MICMGGDTRGDTVYCFKVRQNAVTALRESADARVLGPPGRPNQAGYITKLKGSRAQAHTCHNLKKEGSKVPNSRHLPARAVEMEGEAREVYVVVGGGGERLLELGAVLVEVLGESVECACEFVV